MRRALIRLVLVNAINGTITFIGAAAAVLTPVVLLCALIATVELVAHVL